MLTLLKLLQSLVKALNSEGTPAQVAAGIALGSILGLTPIFSLHNLLAFGAGMMLQVSFPGVMLGWIVFTPVGFLLDPVFHAIGETLLLDVPALAGTWAWFENTPVVAWLRFNNTVVLGSFVGWVVLYGPIYVAARVGVARYRATVYARLKESKLFRAVQASKVYNLYRLFQP